MVENAKNKRRNERGSSLATLTFALILQGCATGNRAEQPPFNGSMASVSSAADAKDQASGTFGQVVEIVTRDHVTPVDIRSLFVGAVRGLERGAGPLRPEIRALADDSVAKLAAIPADEMYDFLVLFGSIAANFAAVPNSPPMPTLIAYALEEMVAGLNDQSIFTRREVGPKNANAPENEGSIGLLMQDVDQQIRVCPLRGSNAERAGIRCGDTLGIVTSNDSRSRIRLSDLPPLLGPVGSVVTLYVHHEPPSKAVAIPIVRESLPPTQNTEALVVGNALYVRAGLLDLGTTEDLRHRIESQLKLSHEVIRGVVLDLRYGGGGPASEIESLAGIFLPPKTLVATFRNERGDPDIRLVGSSGDITGGLPVVVLVDGWTAEGGEIVAGALQDHHRAIVMGSNTAGIGAIRTVFPASPLGQLKLVTGYVILPSARKLQPGGIMPDVTLSPKIGRSMVAPTACGAGSSASDQAYDPAALHCDQATQQAISYLNQANNAPHH